jgi:outer membrane protein assembly factor BamB
LKNTKKHRKILTALIVTSILLFSSTIMLLPSTIAQTTMSGYTAMPDRETQTEVATSPDLVGIGQPIVINIMTYPAPSGPTYEAQSLVPGLTGGFADCEITIQHPDGYVETFMPVDETLAQVGIEIPGLQQIVGHLQFQYTPTKVGEYSMTAKFPGQFYTTDNQYEPAKLSVYYKPSESTKPATVTVQAEKVVESGLLTGWPWSPLPEGYWENPVQTDNREWYQVAGDWTEYGFDYTGSNYNPYSRAPNSPHIVWSNPIQMGGLPGGIWGSQNDGSIVFGTILYTPVVMEGKIYRNGRAGHFECVDLRTGEKLWEAPGSITLGQRLDPAFQTATQLNQGGIDQFLWGNTYMNRWGSGPDTWYRYDPYDGDVVQTITNVPRDLTGIKFQDGSPIVWCVQANLNQWNTTEPLKIPYINLIKWDFSKMVNTVVYSNIYSNDWMDGVVWNVSVKTDDQVSVGDNNFRGPMVYPFWEANVVVVKTPNAMQHALGVDMDTGEILWKNYNMVLDIDVLYKGIATGPNGPLIKHDGASPNYVAYDVRTGREMWRASSGEVPWGMLPCYTYVYHDGVHFFGSYDGHVYAYDSDNGQLVWQSDYTGDEWETIYGTRALNGEHSAVGADGKLYYSSGTTYAMMPRMRFHRLVCIDEFTGDFIWTLPIGITPTAVVDGYLVGQDNDNAIQYVIGKGKTETSVMASPKVISKGSKVLLEGSVLDMSPGMPNTPAVSEEDMSMWMDYLYGQNATLINDPPKPDGVQVWLTAVDSDGNYIDIGSTTSSMDGTYGLAWTPPEEGTYKIVASFMGSNSYWESCDTTYLSVGPAPSTGGPIEPEPEPIPLITTEVAIIAAVAVIAVIGVGSYWVLKKRK